MNHVTRLEIEERIERLREARLCASMSDDLAFSNGTLAAYDRDIAAAQAELAALDATEAADA